MWEKLRTEGAVPVLVVRFEGEELRNVQCILKLQGQTYIEEVQLVRVSRADARCKKQQITLEPRDLVTRELEAHTRSCLVAHCVHARQMFDAMRL